MGKFFDDGFLQRVDSDFPISRTRALCSPQAASTTGEKSLGPLVGRMTSNMLPLNHCGITWKNLGTWQENRMKVHSRKKRHNNNARIANCLQSICTMML